MLKRNSLCVRLERKQYSPSIPVISHLAASRFLSCPFRFRSSRRIMNRPLSLQCCRNACQHRLVGHFLSRGHRSIDVTHNAAEAETERGFFSCLCPAAFSTHKHTYEAIEPPCFLPRASPSFLCPLDRPAQYRERDEETEKRKRETADLVSFIFHGARFVKRIRSSTGSFASLLARREILPVLHNYAAATLVSQPKQPPGSLEPEV